VTASGGLYAPPAKFRPRAAAPNAIPVTQD
jgi:hypothetical protein